MPAPTAAPLIVALALWPACALASCEGGDPGRITLTRGDRIESIALAEVSPGFDLNGAPALTLVLCPDSAAVLTEMTTDALGQKMSLDIDGDPVSNAIVMAEIRGGSLMITGSLSLEEVEDKAKRLRDAAGLAD